MSETPMTRIQLENRRRIMEGALEVFSVEGFRGATLDQISAASGLSKPNLLYYFPSKEAIYTRLLTDLLESWLQPLEEMSPEGEPLDEVLRYVQRKLDMSRDMPRESRLFANEMLRGAPQISEVLSGRLRDLVGARAALLSHWMAEGRLKQTPPDHLIISIWALTQHYADFEVQVRAVLGPDRDPYPEAADYLSALFRNLLAP
ncbi:TetR family transcriptional regulator C-terminal domain-containing protein [Falsigemmobacter intermedius]|uniref:TetR family transcriptional regulator n=1 Tax=Falsigemmobacter intermedius TaxID=1553448 RepID=A0A444MD93_9RHOB|nr:TetR family transcriptional regulator C-terminal domain-containing protein [Falsigemmobacter intermedius]RWY42364.1 TetR family transcriptional regulator [Falsigemmobacter intermedius]